MGDTQKINVYESKYELLRRKNEQDSHKRAKITSLNCWEGYGKVDMKFYLFIFPKKISLGIIKS